MHLLVILFDVLSRCTLNRRMEEVAYSESYHDIKFSLLEKKFTTVTKLDWRVLQLKGSFFTVARRHLERFVSALTRIGKHVKHVLFYYAVFLTSDLHGHFLIIYFYFPFSHEVNLAATDSPLTIIKHYQPSPKALSGNNYQTLRVTIPVRYLR